MLLGGTGFQPVCLYSHRLEAGATQESSEIIYCTPATRRRAAGLYTSPASGQQCLLRFASEEAAVAYPLWLARFLVQTGIARFLPVARRLSDGGGRFLRYYSDAVLSAPVEELLDPAYFPTAGPDVIDLNLPAPRYESSLSVGRVTADRRGHPPAGGLLELRRAIAEHSVRRGGAAIDAQSEAMVAHGAAGAFAAALDAFVNPGDRVVLFDPSSPLFALGAKSRRADLRWVPTTNDEGRCRFSLPDLEKATRGAKLIVLCNPGNPTGASLDEAGFDAIANIAIKRGA